MISEKTQEFKNTLKSVFIPYPDWKNMDWSEARRLFFETVVYEPLPEGTVVSQEYLGGVKTERISTNPDADKVIFHIHGGGMVLGDCTSGRFMLSHVSKYTGRNTVSVDYRLCPEYAQPAAVEDCAAAYQGLLEEGWAPENIAFLGESAGGMLVLALMAYLTKNHLPMPGCACVISGSADPEYLSDSMAENKDTEIVVALNLKEQMKAFYYQDGDYTDPVLNPLLSDVSNWPPVYFHACKDEILRDESVRMYEKLRDAGVETKLTLKEGLFHTYMMYDLPESYEAYKEIAEFFNQY